MKVAVLFSGGKDSAYAVQYCKKVEWKIEALIAVKPSSPEAYLWHYPTVELTQLSAKAMNLPLLMLECKEIGPDVEANVLDEIFSKIIIDAVVLGGVGLQETQIREVKKIAEKYGIKTVVPYDHYTSEELMREEIESGMKIIITECAADGLDEKWLGKEISKKNFDEFKKLSEKHGFDIIGEGGAFNTFVSDAPFFKQSINFVAQKIWDKETRSGYLEAKNAALQYKRPVKVSVQ